MKKNKDNLLYPYKNKIKILNSVEDIMLIEEDINKLITEKTQAIISRDKKEDEVIDRELVLHLSLWVAMESDHAPLSYQESVLPLN